MNRNRLLGLAGAAIAATVALTGCAQPGMQTAAPGQLAAPAGPAVLADIVSQINGTPQQRAAGQERQFYAWQNALGTCMTGKGATFGVPTYVSPGVGDQKIGPGELLAWTPQRADFGHAGRMLAAAKVPGPRDNPALLKLSGEAAEAWLRIQNECEPATHPTEDLHLPAGMVKLNVAFQQELTKIQDELAPGLPAAYAACLEAAGVPTSDLPGVMQLAGQKFPPVRDDKESDPGQLPGWAAAVDLEKRLAATDWQCRGADATRVVNASGARLTAWADAHRAELDAVAAGWAGMPAARDAAKATAAKFTA